MIPTHQQCLKLFDVYQLPSLKRIHVEAVAKLAIYIAQAIQTKNPTITINVELLEAAALLHDIDKNIPRKSGEQHPQTAVRVLTELGFVEVAKVVAHHSVHFILDERTAPKTWEEKILFLADKMTKYEVIGVEHRFKLWYKENLPKEVMMQLETALPKVKQLEDELLGLAGTTEADVVRTQLA